MFHDDVTYYFVAIIADQLQDDFIITVFIPVVPHKAVAEVSKIGNL